MTEDQILEVCRKIGFFSVSFRLQDEGLRRKLRRMVKSGKLSHYVRNGKQLQFYLAKKKTAPKGG